MLCFLGEPFLGKDCTEWHYGSMPDRVRDGGSPSDSHTSDIHLQFMVKFFSTSIPTWLQLDNFICGHFFCKLKKSDSQLSLMHFRKWERRLEERKQNNLLQTCNIEKKEDKKRGRAWVGEGFCLQRSEIALS